MKLPAPPLVTGYSYNDNKNSIDPLRAFLPAFPMCHATASQKKKKHCTVDRLYKSIQENHPHQKLQSCFHQAKRVHSLRETAVHLAQQQISSSPSSSSKHCQTAPGKHGADIFKFLFPLLNSLGWLFMLQPFVVTRTYISIFQIANTICFIHHYIST